jgi:hypothetical protein
VVLIGITDGATLIVSKRCWIDAENCGIAAATNSLLAEDVYRHPIGPLLQAVLPRIVALCTVTRSAFSNYIKTLIFTGTALCFCA